MLTGIVEVGLFCHMAKAAYFGNQDGSVTVRWNDGKTDQVAGAPVPEPEAHKLKGPSKANGANGRAPAVKA